MRGIILALLLTLAGSQKFPTRGQRNQNKGQIPESGTESSEIRLDFIDGKEYLYNYEGIIRNTAQGDGLGQSVVKLTSDIAIYGGDQDNILMFLSPKMEENVGFPVQPRDQFAEPKDRFTEPPKQPGKLDACTQHSYHFDYNNGRIENIRVPEQVPLYCLNMARGVLNMLSATPKNQKEYELQEDGIEGECQTRYVITDDRNGNGAIITRTKDLNNCRNKVKRTIGMSYFYLNPKCPLRNTVVQGTSAFVMKVKYEGSVSQIVQVESEEVYQVSPFSEADGAAVMTAWQKLSLVEARSGQTPKPRHAEKTVSIHYEFPENLPEMILIEDAKKQIEEILEEVNHLPNLPADVLPKYIELSQLCRRLTVEDMNAIYNTYGSRPRARQLLLTGIVYAGTLNSMKFIKDKLIKGELHNMEPYWVVPISLHFANPDVAKMEETARVAAEIFQHVSRSGSFWLQKLVFLAHGSLVHKQCSQSRLCSIKLLEPLHNLLTEAVSHHDENHMILALKSIGNAGQPASLKIVRPLAENDKYTKYIRAVAIQALLQIGKQDPAKVQGILIQIFMNTSAPVQVRIMACMAIFETYPALPLITTIANAVFKEKNPVLFSFVYSQLKACTKYRNPMYYSLSSFCNVAMKLLNPRDVPLNEHYSRVVNLNFFNSVHRFGGSLKFFVVDNPGRAFPSNVILNSELVFSGTTVQPFEVTLQTQGLREWLWKLNVPFDQSPAHQKIKDTERKLPGFKDIPLERPLLAAYLKFLGQEFMFLTPEETIQLRKLGEGKLFGPQAFGMIYQFIKNVNQQMTQALILEARHIVPTTLGLPFEVSASGIAMVHGSLKAKAVENGEDHNMIHKELQLESNIVFQGYGKLLWGINTRFCQHIVEITGNFRTQGSLKMNATWDLKTKNFKVEIDPIHEKYELAMARHEAHVVARHLHSEKKAPVLPEMPEEDILKEEFQPRKDDVKQSRSSYKSNPRDLCFTFQIYPVKVCSQTLKKTKDVVPLRNTWMHFLCEAHDVRLLLTPVVAMEKIKGEVQMLLELPRMKREAKHSGGKDECRDYPIPPEGQDAACTLQYAPVCGSDGVTYSNKCQFCIAKRESGNTITIEYEGECEQKSGSRSQKKQSKQAKQQDPDRYANPDSSSSSSSSLSSHDSSSSPPSSSSSSEPSTKKRQGRKRGDSSSDSSSDTRSSDTRSSSDSSSDTRSSDTSSSSDTRSSDTRSSSDSSSSDTRSSDTSSSSDRKGARRHVNKHLYQKKSKDSSSSSSSSDTKSSSDSDSSSSDTRSSDTRSSSSSSSSDSKSSSDSDSSSSDTRSSDTRSSSSSSSESDEIFEKKGRPREIYQYTFRSVKQQSTKQQNSRKYRQRSSQSSDSSSSSGSSPPISGSSSEENVDYLDKKWIKVLIAHLRIICRDKKPHGVDAVVFKTPSKIRMTVTNITRPGKPVVCFESGMVNPHKFMTSLKSGWDCKEYEVTTEVETGWLSVHPAIRWKLEYPKVPEVLTTIWEPIYAQTPGVAYMLGLSQKVQRNPPREASLVLALTAPNSYIMVQRMPEYTIYGEDLMLPFSVPLNPSIQTSKISDVPLRLLASQNGVCEVKDQTIITFNGQSISKGLVSDCFLDLLQDCTCHKKIMVLVKYESDNNNNILVNITVANTEIVFKSRDGKLVAMLNGTLISSSDDLLRSLKETDQIVLLLKEDKLVLQVENAGLEKLSYDGHNIMVKVNARIGYTCGLCELYGGDSGRLRTPSGFLAKDLVSFAQSWVVPDAFGGTCKLQHSTVRHENPVLIAEENPQCVSNHPVLQCQEGCRPTKTSEISAGFHCVSAGTTLPTELTKLAEKSEDFVDTVQSHMACSCSQ